MVCVCVCVEQSVVCMCVWSNDMTQKSRDVQKCETGSRSHAIVGPDEP
jgi:hypothetical protein